MTFEQRLVRILHGAGDINPTAAEQDGAAIWFIEAAGPMRIKPAPDLEEVAFERPIFFPHSESEIDYDAMAEFNAEEIHDGGWRIGVEDDVCVFISARERLATVEAVGLEVYLNNFIERSAGCAQWYALQVFH